MKILHDYQIFLRQQSGGVSRYHVSIMKKLSAKANVEIRTYVKWPCNYYLKEDFGYPVIGYKNKYGRYILQLLNDFITGIHIIKEYLKGRPYDLIHLTWYKPFYVKAVKFFCRKHSPKIVVTIHDLIHQMEANTTPMYKRGARDMKRVLGYADEIIAISENTKKDLIKYYPELQDKKICVIYHGFMQSNISDSKCIPKYTDYLLFVGKRDGYKNFKNFLFAVSSLKEKYPWVKVVCAGGGVFTQAEKQMIEKLKLENSVIQKFMSDEELVNCYKNAICFVFPSLYEGFGLPILEAFSYGCPIAISRESCFPEIAGDAAIYYDGKNIEDMACQLELLIKDDRLRQKLIAAGHERLKCFSWENTVNETFKVYTKACRRTD